MPDEEKKGGELSMATIIVMAVVALIFDAIQILFSYIGLGWLIIPIAYLTFIVWFWMHGLNFLNLKRAKTIGFGIILELVSAGIIPSLTFTVLRVALDSKLKTIVPRSAIINK